MTRTKTAVQIFVAFAIMVIAGTAGYLGYSNPSVFLGAADHMIGVLSVLVGVSLAVSAVLASPVHFSGDAGIGEAERSRIETVVNEDDEVFSRGLLAYYYVTLSSLILLIIVLLFDEAHATVLDDWSFRLLAGVTSFISVTSILLSFRLPILLVRSARLRNW